jgi:hypothetical protein
MCSSRTGLGRWEGWGEIYSSYSGRFKRHRRHQSARSILEDYMEETFPLRVKMAGSAILPYSIIKPAGTIIVNFDHHNINEDAVFRTCQPCNGIQPQTSHIIDCFSGSFCYIQTVFLLNWLISQPAYEVRTAMEGDQMVFLNLASII